MAYSWKTFIGNCSREGEKKVLSTTLYRGSFIAVSIWFSENAALKRPILLYLYVSVSIYCDNSSVSAWNLFIFYCKIKSNNKRKKNRSMRPSKSWMLLWKVMNFEWYLVGYSIFIKWNGENECLKSNTHNGKKKLISKDESATMVRINKSYILPLFSFSIGIFS